MTAVRIWALGPFYDAETVKVLPDKLAKHLQMSHLTIRTSSNMELPCLNGKGLPLSEAVRHYLEQESCVIFLIDNYSSIDTAQRWREPKSLINQVEQVVSDSRFAGKVFRVHDFHELDVEAVRKSLGPGLTTWDEEWERVLARFHEGFADTPEEEVLRDLEEALAEVRREQT